MITGDVDCFDYQLAQDDKTLQSLLGDGIMDDSMEREIEAFVAGTSEVLCRQLSKYLTGDFSNPSDKLLEETENAPIHNMESERTLGMVDAQIRRAPNAGIDLISAKVRCKKNKTMDWLSGKSVDSQRKLIRSAVQQRRAAITVMKQRRERNLRIMNQRLYENVQKKEKKQTKLVETVAAKFASQGQELTAAIVKSEFPSLDSEKVDQVVQICHAPNSIIGRECTHLWYDEENCQWDLYYGSIKSLKGRKYIKFIVEYWFPDSPEDSHDAVLMIKQIIADLILGDLVFT